MADDIRVNLIAAGAKQFVNDFNLAVSAVASLQTKLESVDRIRTNQITDNIRLVRASLERLEEDGVSGIEALVESFKKLEEQVKQTSRIRTPQLLQGPVSQAQTSLGEVGVQRNLQAISGTQTTNFQESLLKSRQAQALNEAATISASAAAAQQTGILQKLQGVYSTLNNAVLRFSDSINQSSKAQASSGAQATVSARQQQQQEKALLAVESANNKVAKAQLANQSAVSRLDALQKSSTASAEALAKAQLQVESSTTSLKQAQLGAQSATLQLTEIQKQQAQGLTEVGNAQQQSGARGITYLSTLSAIHAMSFIATNSTFTLFGSFLTLIAAFGKLGLAGAAAGAAIGVILGVFNAIGKGIEILQQAFLTSVGVILSFTTAVTAASVAAGVAGVKMAADVEQSFAVVQALAGPTIAQFKRLETQVGELSLEFGVSAKDVSEAASLYIRAGGSIEKALDGALRAVIELQVASAGELEAATAARSVAVGVAAFAKEMVTATDVANALARAAHGSALSFTEVNQAFQQAVPGAVTLGLTLNEVAATIAVLGNNALRGTVAGTAFKQFLLDLINPSKDAKKSMDALGISIVDNVTGKIRPLVDILGDLEKALKDYEAAGGEAADATKAQAIANIFGSRAALSANIIIRESVAALEDFEEKTKDVTAANIAQTLLKPLNAQFKILTNTLAEVARAFGAPLVGPIASSMALIAEQVKGLIPIFTLLGQAVSVIIGGQGFEALQVKIGEITQNNDLTSFLIELVNVFRNVRDVIENQIIPAIKDFLNTLGLVASESGRIEDATNFFNTLNIAIQASGKVIGDLIRGLGELIAGFIQGTGRGGELRDLLDDLVTRILVGFVLQLSLLVPVLFVAIKSLDFFTDVAINVAKVILKATNAINEFGLNLKEMAEKAAIGIQIGIAIAAQDLDRVKQLEVDLIRLQDAFTIGRAQARQDSPVAALLSELEDFSDRTHKIQGTVESFAERIKKNNASIIQSFDNTAGELPDILSNIIKQVNESQSALSGLRPGGTVGQPPAADTERQRAIDAATKQITEAGEDIARRLNNIAEDSATKTDQIVDRALERIGDVIDKRNKELEKLHSDTQERIKDIEEGVSRAREERGFFESLRRLQDERFDIFQKRLDKEETAQRRSNEDIKSLEQDATENAQIEEDKRLAASERMFARYQQAAERAFQEVQRSQQKALEQTQSAEEKALQRTLDAESRARDEQQTRLEAKTPEDRIKAEASIQASRRNAAFQASQQSRIDALRTKHEREQNSLRITQEAEQVSFRISQEEEAVKNREKNDAAALVKRRTLELNETRARRLEEDATTARRIENEIKVDAERRKLQAQFQTEQDRLQNVATQRRIQEVGEDAAKREVELRTRAIEQIKEIIDSVNLSLREQSDTVDREIRNALQRLEDIEQSLTPDVKAAVQGMLDAIKLAASSRSLELLENLEKKHEQARAVIGAQTTISEPTGARVVTLERPPWFMGDIARGMFEALVRADQIGVFESGTQIDPALIQQMTRYLAILSSPQPVPLRR